MDYQNQSNQEKRWIDRISTDYLYDTEMNIYNFFSLVFEKLRALLFDQFQLNAEQLRDSNNEYDTVLREALTNCLAHADYEQSFPSIKVVAHNDWFSFLNPGSMLISKKEFIKGGSSWFQTYSLQYAFFR